VFQGRPLAYPTSVKAKYREQMLDLMLPMIEEYERAISSIANSHRQVVDAGITQDATLSTIMERALGELGKKWASKFAELATEAPRSFIGRINDYANTSLNKSLYEMSGQLWIHTPKLPKGLHNRLLSATRENVALIKTIPSEYHKRIHGAVTRSITKGDFGAARVFEEVSKIGHSTAGRAELIAVDQTRKITTAMNTERMRSIGVKEFRWIHSHGGGEPRKLHLDYDGEIFDINDPPIIDRRTGERGYPGELINCKCKMAPVVDFSRYLGRRDDNTSAIP